MGKYIHIVLFLGFSVSLFAQNPHGENLVIDCAACHSPEGWEIAAELWRAGELVVPEEVDGKAFSHSETNFPLTGQHRELDCKMCHDDLVFSNANSECISCHTDLHQMTVGSDCARCHSTDNWLVDDIMELHLENGFPLLGNHAVASCFGCHTAETTNRFDRIGNDCINCHLDEYMATTEPNHQAAGFSTDCMECHDLASPEWFWTAETANHSFFPLEKGHEISDCAACHTGGDFMNTPTDCFACHETDFQNTTSPNHVTSGLPTDCALCHTTDPGWNANDFSQHDELYFPIFSGEHNNEWNDCNDCHTTAGNFMAFSCIDCHEHNNPGDLADEHDEVGDYQYNSQACYQCHPDGKE